MPLTNDDFLQILEQSHEPIAVTDPKGIILYTNDRFTEITGYTQEELIGNTPSVLKSGKTPRDVYKSLWTTIRSGRVWSGRLINRRKAVLPLRLTEGNPELAKNEYWTQLTISPIFGKDGEIRYFSATHRDITEEVSIERRFKFERCEAKTRADISMILQTKDTLKSRLARTLERLMSLGDLNVENKCGIFIKNEEGTHLDLFLTHGEFTREFLDKEKQIPVGNCLCGKVALSGKVTISDDCFCDPNHENTFTGMTAHGHYIVPLRAFDNIIGVMFLYTAPYPSHDEHRLRMLQTVGDSIALAIINDQTEKQLVEATLKADEASRAKSEFLANMSHEIRTPLNGILGFTDMLLRDGDKIDAADRKEWLEVIHESGQHLLHLINGILDLSKVEAGQLDVEKTECNPTGIVSDLASILRVQALEKQIKLDIEFDGPLPKTILTDPTRLRQILTNLIGNALKFTREGSVIVTTRMETREDDNADLVFTIADTGPGIPAEKLETIFEPFSQADTSITRQYGGTGLGLAISRRFAEALGGSLTVESEPGEGSTFILTIPIGSVRNIEICDSFSTESVRSERTISSQETPSGRLSGHVLLVDDGQTNRQLIELILSRAGAEVTTADNGHRSLTLAARNAYDLILMDMQMPIMDGYTATQKIREFGITTPIIALTASAMKGDRERCLAAGCDDYLTKPVEIDALLSLASKWISAGKEESSDNAVIETAEEQVRPEINNNNPEDFLPSLPMDDPEFHEIILNYVEDLVRRVSEMEQYCEQQDYDNLARLAHWLKGSGGTAGFNQLTDLASSLENSTRKQQTDTVNEIIQEIRRVTEQINQSIRTLSPAKQENDE